MIHRIQNFLFLIFFLFLAANCGNEFSSQSDIVLKDDELLMGDVIVKKNEVVGYGLSDEERILAEEEYSRNLASLLENESSTDVQASGFALKKYNRWPNGVVPYVFAKSISADMKKEFIRECKELGNYANIRCRTKRSTDKGWIFVKTSDTACGWSYYGRLGGRQDLTVGKKCWYNKKAIKHEIMHALGVLHEHQRPNRGKYIKIKWKNIKSDKKSNFYMFKGLEVAKQTYYDLDSIMLYHSWTFSKNGEPTMLPVNTSNGEFIYSNNQMSKRDHNILVKLYGGTSPFSSE